MTTPPLTAILTATEAARSPRPGLTHAELTEACIRPCGTPPSHCRGSLEFRGGAVDAAQQGEGEADDTVTIDIFRCDHCRHNLIVAICPDGWRLRNEYPGGVPKGD